jgi:hypothetical protein
MSQSVYQQGGAPAALQHVQSKWAYQAQGWRVDVEVSTSEEVVFVHDQQRLVVVAYRGSVTGFDWLVSDVALAIGHRKYSPRFVFSQQRFQRGVVQKYPQRVGWQWITTGHSLGGALAEFVANAFPNTQAYTFNQGSGIRDIHRVANPNVHQYFVEGDPLSNLGRNRTSTLVRKSPSGGFEHSLEHFICTGPPMKRSRTMGMVY